MSIPVSWRYGIGCIVACAVVSSIALAQPAEAVEPPIVTVLWAMPNGGTAENVTWPQTEIPGGESAIPCGVTAQVDDYLEDEAARFTADGTLTEFEDYPSETQRGSIDWRFVYGGDCAPGESSSLPVTGGAPVWLLAPFAGITVFGVVLLLLAHRNRHNANRKAS